MVSSAPKSDIRSADREMDSYEMADGGKGGKWAGTMKDQEDMRVLGKTQVLNVSRQRCMLRVPGDGIDILV